MRFRSHAAEAIILGAAVLVYAVSVSNQRIGDDTSLVPVRLDPATVSADDLWVQNYWGSIDPDSSLYRPLSLTMLFTERLLFDLDPRPFHVVSIALHASACLLCYWLFLALSTPTIAFFTALIFAVHPIHAEAVITNYGQVEILAALFTLASLWLYVLACKMDQRWFLAASLAAFFAGLLSKESAAAVPLLVVLTRGLMLAPRRTGWRRWISRRELWYGVPLAVYATMRFAMVGSLAVQQASTALRNFSGAHKAAMILVGLANYARLATFPTKQSMIYDVFYHQTADALWLCGLALGCILLTRIIGTLPVLFAVGWFLSFWLIFSNSIVPSGVFVAERCLYLAMAGTAFLTASLFDWYWRALPTPRRGMLSVISAAALLAASWQTVRLERNWSTEELAWRWSTQVRPESPTAHALLALRILLRMERGENVSNDEVTEAELSIQKSLDLEPNLPEGLRAMGLLAGIRGDYAGAVRNLTKAAAARPNDTLIRADLERFRAKR